MASTFLPRYVIIGSGRVAQHFVHYFSLLKLPFKQWSRRNDSEEKLIHLIEGDVRVLVLIKDVEIEPFIQVRPFLHDKICIHFSGSLLTSFAYGAHPLYAFVQGTYALAIYEQIPFFVEKEGLAFEKLLPGLNNPHFMLEKSMKPLYHSLCVLSGNFSCMLWQKFFDELEHHFHIPKEAAFPYMRQCIENLQTDSKNALTGPLVRDDKKTIAANLQALASDPFQRVYQAFVDIHTEKSNKK